MDIVSVDRKPSHTQRAHTPAPAIPMSAADDWLGAHVEDHTGERADMNQYWYSGETIAVLNEVIADHCLGRPGPGAGLEVAFLSTPSLFFALGAAQRHNSRVFEYDRAFGEGEPNFVFYDFNEPTALPAELEGAFSAVVIDPPFITHDVWAKYCQTAQYLLAPGGRVIATTVIENAALLHERLLCVAPTRFLPSIPNLPYQYAVYTNFEAPRLSVANSEVPHDPEVLLAEQRGAAAQQAAERAAEAPVRGGDFEAMLAAALAAETREGAPPTCNDRRPTR